MQASVNPKAETVEELLARRKNLHMGMLKLAKEDLALILQARIDGYAVSALPRAYCEPTCVLRALIHKHTRCR